MYVFPTPPESLAETKDQAVIIKAHAVFGLNKWYFMPIMYSTTALLKELEFKDVGGGGSRGGGAHVLLSLCL